ncbi:hypothetical protein FQN60_014637 [Etheostoma spectabile]|uniref:SH3 domain-containing protein n=1 Tax=Etheostoma spectabile TaxID=54343 RepID=A0A5J5DBW3_9PERO|nr:hypothetical protein FQN60_014637 [Etheostoma spectabile]
MANIVVKRQDLMEFQQAEQSTQPGPGPGPGECYCYCGPRFHLRHTLFDTSPTVLCLASAQPGSLQAAGRTELLLETDCRRAGRWTEQTNNKREERERAEMSCDCCRNGSMALCSLSLFYLPDDTTPLVWRCRLAAAGYPSNQSTSPILDPITCPHDLTGPHCMLLGMQQLFSRGEKTTQLWNLNVLAKALYDNVAESPDELSFRKGDIMTVLERDTQGLDGWWLCSLHGRQGIVPGNRLKILVGMYDSKQQQQATPSTPEPATSYPSSQRSLPPLSAYAQPSPSPSSAASATSSSGYPNKPLHSAQYTPMRPAYSTPSPAQPNADSIYMMPPSHSPKPSPQSVYQIPSGPSGLPPGPPSKAQARAQRQYQDIYQVPPSVGSGPGQGATPAGGTGVGQDVYQQFLYVEETEQKRSGGQAVVSADTAVIKGMDVLAGHVEHSKATRCVVLRPLVPSRSRDEDLKQLVLQFRLTTQPSGCN